MPVTRPTSRDSIASGSNAELTSTPFNSMRTSAAATPAGIPTSTKASPPETWSGALDTTSSVNRSAGPPLAPAGATGAPSGTRVAMLSPIAAVTRDIETSNGPGHLSAARGRT
jgi:hypothetical protein